MKRQFWKKLRKEIRLWQAGVLPGGVVIGLIAAVRLAGWLQPLEWMALDNLLRSRPPEPIDPRIVIVGINENDIRQINQYPIPDRDLAQLLKNLNRYQPAVIGLDIFRDLPVQPGHTKLAEVFETTPGLIAIRKVLPDQSGGTVNPPPAIPPKNVGFADMILDEDSALRRSLLGTLDLENNYHFSFAVLLAQRYLEPRGIRLRNGDRDPDAMQFGTIELTRFQPNTGGYVRADAGGNQILLNYRSGRTPFRVVSLQAVQQGKVNPDWLRGKIVLIGVTAPSVKDTVKSVAAVRDRWAMLYGVEAQAHSVSQIVSAVLDQRPLLQSWFEGWEYLWIIGWGILGISLGRFLRSPLRILLGVAIAAVALVGISYAAVIGGWWLPLVPALLALILNGAGLAAALFYQDEQELRSRLSERQMIIDYTFNTIHNGPLQTLALLQQRAQNPDLTAPHLLPDLQHLNQELRSVYDTIKREAVIQDNRFHLTPERELDLQMPLHELLDEVYQGMLDRNFPCFQALKVKVVAFEPLDERFLDPERKREICQFLEEALCNVGKHAEGATRLEVLCQQIDGRNVIRVIDNGRGYSNEATEISCKGLGTRQAKRLGQRLGGQFVRYSQQGDRSTQTPGRTVCELNWSAKN